MDCRGSLDVLIVGLEELCLCGRNCGRFTSLIGTGILENVSSRFKSAREEYRLGYTRL